MYCDDPELNYANLKALQKQLDEMYTYIRNNQMMIPNYGEMRRYGEPVSTAFVESNNQRSDRPTNGQKTADAVE